MKRTRSNFLLDKENRGFLTLGSFIATNSRKVITTLLLLTLLPVLVYLTQKAVSYFTNASEQPPNLVLDTQSSTVPLPRPWQGLSQGGESLPSDFLANINGQLRSLFPSYIRIDHLFNKHIKIEKTSAGITIDFTSLDNLVNQILNTGALPFFSLSYMPPALSTNDITSPPKNWSDWTFIVQKTIEHYSGTFQNGKQLPNLYYEVWNEPDLFGNWLTYGNSNYLNLYRASSVGATSAKVTQSFKLGGPATTGFYPNWINVLLKTSSAENLKLDFISWHRYSPLAEDFKKDGQAVQEILNQYPNFSSLPRIISEWGYTGDNHPYYDNQTGAAHLIATTRQLLDYAELALIFEIQDGESPNQEPFWGRWGLLTSPNSGNRPKPRYHALALLNQLPSYRLPLSGENKQIKAIAAKNLSQFFLLIVNYDPNSPHKQTIPITLTNISSEYSQLTLEKINLYGKISSSTTLSVQNQTVSTSIILAPQEITLLRFSPPKATPS